MKIIFLFPASFLTALVTLLELAGIKFIFAGRLLFGQRRSTVRPTSASSVSSRCLAPVKPTILLGQHWLNQILKSQIETLASRHQGSRRRASTIPTITLSILAWLTVATVVALLPSACTTAKRPTEPPRGSPHRVPDGAVALSKAGMTSDISLEKTLSHALDHRFTGDLEHDEKGCPVFRVLAISGGGSRGAYGAGVLEGWTASGTRPDFEVVTGISTGALMATFAFLGSEYDRYLRVYTKITNEDIFVSRGPLAALTADALRDTAPLRELLAREITAEVLDAVARAHVEEGRRLFVGTTNLDSNTFTMWDMGAIASSNRPDKLERYRDIVLASASFPMLFPPVYLPVEVDGEFHYQMHVDGSVRAAVFASTFMLDLDDAIERWGFGADDVRGEIWVIHNGQRPDGMNQPIAPKVTAIAEASINSLLEASTRSSFVALYTLAMVNGFEFSFTTIPVDFELGTNPLNFDQTEMSKLYRMGREATESGRAWRRQPPPSEAFELLQILDPSLIRFTGADFPEIPRRPPRWMRAYAPLDEKIDLTLCAGKSGTSYDSIGSSIRKRLASMRLEVRLFPTPGSVENLQRLREGTCDAALAQHDAYFMQVLNQSSNEKILDVLRPKYVFDEFVFLVCNREAGVRGVGDLRQRPDRYRLLIGEPGSGSVVTWKAFTLLNQKYGSIPVEVIGDREALEIVTSNDPSVCVFHTGTLDSWFLRSLNKLGENLRLVAVDDWDFNDAAFAGERVYAHGGIPAETYSNLQADLDGSSLPTVTVGSSVFVAKRWAQRHPQGYRLLLNAVSQTRLEMFKDVDVR